MISIVTVTYNCENTIKKTIKSVLSIKNKDIEYIVIDGKSSDETLNIVNDYKSSIDIIISEEDGGLYDAMNKAANYASGTHIMYLNSGDEILKSGFLSLINKVEQNKTYIGDTTWNSDKRVGLPRRDYSFKLMRMWNHQAMLVPTSFMRKNKFNTEYHVSADLDLKMKIFKSGMFKKLEIDVVQSLPGGISQERIHIKEYLKRVKQKFKIANTHLKLPWKIITPTLHGIRLVFRLKLK